MAQEEELLFHRTMGPWMRVGRCIFWEPKSFGTQTTPIYPIIKFKVLKYSKLPLSLPLSTSKLTSIILSCPSQK